MPKREEFEVAFGEGMAKFHVQAKNHHDAVKRARKVLGVEKQFSIRDIQARATVRKVNPKKVGRKKKRDIFSPDYTGPF